MMEEKITRQNIGIDVSKKDFIACLCNQHEQGIIAFGKSAAFQNDKTGFNQFVKWARKYCIPSVPLSFTMEATGIYHESLAFHLHKLNFAVAIVLPNKVKHYAKCLNIKTKTDKVDAKIIARMGAEQQLSPWEPPRPIFQKIRALTRHLQELKSQKLIITNHLESINNSAFKDDFILKSNERILKMLNKQILACEKQINNAVHKEDSQLANKVKYLETIKGVGIITIATIIGETQGFSLFSSRKQLASYAGLDVVERQSGVNIRGKTHISKKGNKHIRRALYFPAMVACRHNPNLKEDFLRITQNKPYKKSGIVAIQRKLLLLMYTIWKKEEPFKAA